MYAKQKTFFCCLSCILSIILILCCFPCCANKKYEHVSSITITTNGETKTFSSSRSNQFGAPIEVTEEEYIENHTGRDLGNVDDKKIKTLSFETINKKHKGTTSYFYSEPLLEGYWYNRVVRYEFSIKIFYWKKPYIKTNFSFVYVKIINDTTVRIKTSKNETTYTVTSYSIRK